MWNGTYLKCKWLVGDELLNFEKNLTQLWQIWQNELQDEKLVNFDLTFTPDMMSMKGADVVGAKRPILFDIWYQGNNALLS